MARLDRLCFIIASCLTQSRLCCSRTGQQSTATSNLHREGSAFARSRNRVLCFPRLCKKHSMACLFFAFHVDCGSKPTFQSATSVAAPHILHEQQGGKGEGQSSLYIYIQSYSISIYCMNCIGLFF